MDKQAVVKYVELSTAALDDAHNKLAGEQAARTQYLEAVNQAVDKMVAGGTLRKDAAAHAAAVLANPIQALNELVQLSLSAPAADAADRIGSVSGSGLGKAASAPIRSGGSARRDADIAFLRGLGLPSDLA